MPTKKAVKKPSKPATKSVKAPAKKRRASKKSVASLRSFRVYRDNSFLEFRVTRQTVYWTILVAFIILMQLWILKVQLEVIQATDDLTTSISE